MKKICLYFQVHQPVRIRRYRFFDIKNDHYYYDDFLNESVIRRVADNCYLPVNQLLLEKIKQHKNKFRISFSISGLAIDQFSLYAPEVIESFQKLAKTGCVEFLSETYSHSLASLINKDEFITQVEKHANTIETLFGKRPTVFRNTELIYSDQIGADIFELGYKGMLTEGAKHILGWKSPDFLYCNQQENKLKVLLRNYRLSDDIAFRFSNKNWSEYPLTAEKYCQWLNEVDPNAEIINLFMDYETFGEHQKAPTGIMSFLQAFISQAVLNNPGLSFTTPSEAMAKLQPVATVKVPYPISWADEERDLSAWLGNELQEDAFQTLYQLRDQVMQTDDPKTHANWNYLQASDHFYYMSTKFFADGDVHAYFNPFDSPYDAYINYMNALSDFAYELEHNPNLLNKDKNMPVYLPDPKETTTRATKTNKARTTTKKTVSKKNNTPKNKKP